MPRPSSVLHQLVQAYELDIQLVSPYAQDVVVPEVERLKAFGKLYRTQEHTKGREDGPLRRGSKGREVATRSEPDGTASVDLPGKNTNFAIAYAHHFDSVCDFDNGDATPLERRA